jgi:hypothetical protein
MKIVSFEDAFSLDEWMGENDKCTIPGGEMEMGSHLNI